MGARIGSSKPVLTTQVVAAATDIKLGTVLDRTDLTTMEIQGPVPKGAILKPESVIGRGVISDIYQGEPILESRLAPQGSGGGLASTIPTGHEGPGGQGGPGGRRGWICNSRACA